MTSFETSPEKDIYFYHGSEAEKADIAAKQALHDGKWEEFMTGPIQDFAHIVKDAQIPDTPPQYRDFDNR